MNKGLLIIASLILSACGGEDKELPIIEDACRKNTDFLKKAFSNKQCACISTDISKNLEPEILADLNNGLKKGDVKTAVKNIKAPVAIASALKTCIADNTDATKEQKATANEFQELVEYLQLLEAETKGN